MISDKKIKISFVIPVYNSEQYLNKCVDSILEAKQENTEVILVDDGSTDKSSTICDTYADNNKSVITIHKKNGGVSSSRNAGLEKASGEYIFFIDNDDWLDSSKIKGLIDIIDKINPDIIINKSFIYTENGELIKNDFIQKEKINGKTAEEVINYFRTEKIKIGAPWQYLFKKEIATKNNVSFNPDQNGVDDSYFSAALFVNCRSFYLNDEIIYYWRQRINSQGRTHGKHEYILKMISSIKSMENYLGKVKEEYKKAFIYFNIYKNTYSLLGQYGDYSEESKKILLGWYNENKKLISKSTEYSGKISKILNIIFGNFYGMILNYKFAKLKSKIYLTIYKNKK
jgi:glycosyltransferase involved in cell wall biosynthesis